MENKCISCKGKLRNKIVNYEIYKKNIGKFPALVCDSCGEQWFSEETSRKIEEKEKELGLFGLSIETKVSYSGNSLIIRIPQGLAKFLNIKKESKVELVPESKTKLCIAIK